MEMSFCRQRGAAHQGESSVDQVGNKILYRALVHCKARGAKAGQNLLAPATGLFRPAVPADPLPMKDSMTSAIYSTSIPVFKQMLGGLKDVLRKAEAHAIEKKIEPDALLLARLYPDMFPLRRQVQVASDFAKSVSARLAGVEVPKLDDTELTFADLQARIDTVLKFIEGLDAALFDEAATREIITQAGTPKEKRFTGQSYLLNYGLPHFFFHTATSYGILRHSGVEVGKKDYIGGY